MLLIPSIDLRGGACVRLLRGDFDAETRYEADAHTLLTRYCALGASWLHIVDLDGAKEGRPVQTELISQITAGSGMNVQVGGGVRATDDIARLRAAGAKRVVVGTRAMEDWTWFDRLVHTPEFAGRIVLALDAKGGHVATRGWTHASEKLAVAVARQVSDWPLAAILYTDVAKDGMLQGPNFLQTRAIAEAGRVPVIASGGVGSIDHVRQLSQLPIWGAIVGRSLYEGTVDLSEAIAVASA